MKKVMLIALMGMFSLAMFAQAQDKAKSAEKKAEPAKVETTKPASKETAKPAKHHSKDAAKHGETKAEAPKK
jgi:uncharacterized protein YdeI (BOF family)